MMPLVLTYCLSASIIPVLLIPFSFGDKPEGDPNQDEFKYELSPKTVVLFAKALHNIVERNCPGVDDLELDAFQAYLNRQIMNGEVHTLRQPEHFNQLYDNLTGCANYLAGNTQRHDEPIPEQSVTHLENVNGKLQVMKESITGPENSGAETVSSSSIPKILKEDLALKDSSTLSSDIQESKRGNPPSGTVADFSEVMTSPTDDNATIPPRRSTVVEKIVDATKSVLRQTYAKATYAISHWFGRRKRDVIDNKQGVKQFYTKLPLQWSPEEESDSQSMNVIATAGWVNAEGHFVKVLKHIEKITFHACPSDFPIDVNYLTMVSKLMLTCVSADLSVTAQENKYLSVNSKLERDLGLCTEKTQSVK